MNELIEEKRELDIGFILIMEQFKTLFVDNKLSMENFNKPDIEYSKLEKKLSYKRKGNRGSVYKKIVRQKVG